MSDFEIPQLQTGCSTRPKLKRFVKLAETDACPELLGIQTQIYADFHNFHK